MPKKKVTTKKLTKNSPYKNLTINVFENDKRKSSETDLTRRKPLIISDKYLKDLAAYDDPLDNYTYLTNRYISENIVDSNKNSRIINHLDESLLKSDEKIIEDEDKYEMIPEEKDFNINDIYIISKHPDIKDNWAKIHEIAKFLKEKINLKWGKSVYYAMEILSKIK
jgi:hypothetical protein